jgi:hypothetical protein
VSWGAVFSGTLIGAALMTLLSLLWYALAVDNAGSTFDVRLGWWIAGSAIASTLVAAFLSAWVTRGHGITLGVLQGLTVWGLLTIAVAVLAPGLVTAYRALVAASSVPDRTTLLWTSFWSVTIGLVAALVGGALGGAFSAPVREATVVERPDDVDVTERAPQHVAR